MVGSASVPNTSGTLSLLSSVIANIHCAVELSHVNSIENYSDSKALGSIDLAAFWDLNLELDHAPRRSVTIQTAKGARQLLLGDILLVQSLPSTSLSPLPDFLLGLSTRAGIKALYLDGDEIGYLLDVNQLNSCREEE